MSAPCWLVSLFVCIWTARKIHRNLCIEGIDTVGEFSLGLFVSLSIISMKLWQLAGLAGPMVVMLLAQVVMILIYCYVVDFYACGKNYDAAIIAVGHTGFGTGLCLYP